jgi:hypothetical protein
MFDLEAMGHQYMTRQVITVRTPPHLVFVLAEALVTWSTRRSSGVEQTGLDRQEYGVGTHTMVCNQEDIYLGASTVGTNSKD